MARNHRYYLDILIGVVIHLYCHKDRNIFFFLDKKESKNQGSCCAPSTGYSIHSVKTFIRRNNLY